MKIRLAPNWGTIVKRAWSIRFMLLAAFLSALEVGVSLMDGYLDVPRGIFAVAAMLITMAAFVARIVAQQGITPDVE